MFFPVSGVETPVWLPPLVAFCISFATSMGGVSGAFLLLPFQVSVLGYTAPSVSATNQVYNILAIPSGVYRYIREGRMVWPLAWATVLGTLPGVFIGAWVRVTYLPDPRRFRLFASCVLFYIGLRLLVDIFRRCHIFRRQDAELPARNPTDRSMTTGATTGSRIAGSRFSIFRVEYSYQGHTYSFALVGVLVLCFVVGIAGGIYGIGGGAILAPFFVAILGLPVYTVAGAALFGTFVTSLAGVAFYHLLALYHPEIDIAPDWILGLLFGCGGVAGMYCGARCQKLVPEKIIKSILCCSILFVAVRYVVGFFLTP